LTVKGTGNVPAGSLQNPPRLSVRARELLAAADPGTYRSRSELLRACLVALANTGTPGHVAVGLILDARTAAGDRSCVAVKAAERDARWLAAEWDRACAWVVTHPARSAAARNVAAQALEAARAIRWDRGLGVQGVVDHPMPDGVPAGCVRGRTARRSSRSHVGSWSRHRGWAQPPQVRRSRSCSSAG
jgi:hypothetical protein